MATLNIRVDDTVKQQAEAVFAELGLSLSTAVTVFLKQAIRCNGIPFDLRLDPFYSASNMAVSRGDQKGG
jgi:DNA-damage-inducible protein J